MRRMIVSILICLALTVSLIACKNGSVTTDYANATVYEQALNDGTDTIGKIIYFVVESINPNSTFGYNLMAGEHLNFCSSTNPNVKVGDGLTIKIKEINYFIGSYIIYYDIIK
jgi:hypothetical protein